MLLFIRGQVLFSLRRRPFNVCRRETNQGSMLVPRRRRRRELFIFRRSEAANFRPSRPDFGYFQGRRRKQCPIPRGPTVLG